MFEAALRRDRAVVAAALAVLTVLAWAYVLKLSAGMGASPAADMSGIDMAGMDMPGVLAPRLAPWSVSEFIFTFGMWAVMMVGMMTPSAAPMVLIYARVGREAAARGKPFAATGWFLAGYLLTWSAFALLATTAQYWLSRAALIDAAMAGSSRLFGGVVLIAVGLYQWTPIKDACLSQCQSPLTFIQRNGGFRRDARGALLLGLRHGAYCVGCCWALMALLFIGGVMNVLWIAAITAFVFIEKVLPAGRAIGRAAGAGAILAGIWMAVG